MGWGAGAGGNLDLSCNDVGAVADGIGKLADLFVHLRVVFKEAVLAYVLPSRSSQ
jgi:hypothetical protein